MILYHEDDRCKLYHGNSTEYPYDDVDLIFTNPYAPLPKHFHSKPMIICDFFSRHKLAEERCGTELKLLSKWYNGLNAFWVGNYPTTSNLDLTAYNPVLPEGWFPEEMVERILSLYHLPKENWTVWDGFMGRGTVGKVCRKMGVKFVGIDKELSRVKLAADYILS